MTKNVLIFPCGTEIGLEIHRSISYSTHFRPFGANSIEENPGRFVFRNYCGHLTTVDDPSFLDDLNRLIKQHDIDIVYPAHDEVLTFMACNKDRIDSSVVAHPMETCLLCRSKKNTYAFFADKVRTPMVFDSISSVESLPVFSKPDVGQGSKGSCIVNTREDLEQEAKKPKQLVCEYLPGPEYTVECITNGDGELIFCEGRIRNTVTNGIATNTRMVDHPGFRSFANTINRHLSFNGAWFFQLKESSNGELALLEIGPRIPGSTALVRNLGANLPLVSLFLHLNIPVSLLPSGHNPVLGRYLANSFLSDLEYDSVYIDLDDTIIIDSKLNLLAVAFLYQCINKQKHCTLLTRRQGDIRVYLESYRILHLFDSVIQVGDDCRKSRHIDRPRSIFIDDSFSERLEVRNTKEIPVFDTSAIESLLDWRV